MCGQHNRLDARYCARCGTTLKTEQDTATSQPPPHWGFTAIFLCFLLVALVGLISAVGPVMLLIVPVAAIAFLWGSGSKGSRRRARYNQ
jgi:hypothetical protein